MSGRYGMVLGLFLAMGAIANANPELDKMHAEAKQAYENGEFPKAKDLTTKILQQNPKDHAALYLRASARVELGVVKRDVKEIRDGIEDARESLIAGGSNEVNYYMPYLYGMIALANIEDKKEHANVALTVAKTILTSTKANPTPEQRANILYQRASAYLYLRDLNAAIDDYQAAIKSFPAHLGSYMGLAQCFIIAEQPDKALQTFSAAVEVLPDNHLAYNNRGLFLQQQGKVEEALQDFNKAIQLDPKFATAYTNRGFTLQGQGKLAEAEADFNKAIELEPKNPFFTSLRGTCRLSQGNLDGAIEDFTQAIQLNPQSPVPHGDLGFARFFAKDYKGSYLAFRQATEIDPVGMRFLNPWKVWSLVLSATPDGIEEIAEQSRSKEAKDRDWIDEQVLYLIGEVSEQGLVDYVKKQTDPKMKNAQLCEAYFFIAERRLQTNDKANATAFYTQVLATKQQQLSAFRGAQFMLQSFAKQ